MGKNYPLSVSRSNILGTEAFRNLLGESLKKSKTRIVILSAYVKKIGVILILRNIGLFMFNTLSKNLTNIL